MTPTSASHIASVPDLAPDRLERRASILHVCTRYARGGSEQRLRDMIDAMAGSHHHVVLGRDSDAERLSEEFPAAAVTVEPALQRAPHPGRDFTAYRALRALMSANRFDLLCTHQSKAGFVGRLAARHRVAHGTIHSLSMANFGAGYSRTETIAFKLAERMMARHTTAYAVVGADLAQRFAANGIQRDQLHIIRSAARLPTPSTGYAASRSRCAQAFELPVERPWIVYLGSLEARKNVLSLPVVLQQVLLHWPQGEPPMLVVAGDGPLRGDLSRLLTQMDLADDAVLLGHVADPTMLVAGSDVLVLLSNAEGLPQVLVQAVAAQLPFVAYDVDGVEELLRFGASGRVVEPGNVLAAADEVLDLLLRGSRQEREIELGDWSRDEILASYRALFMRLLDTPRN